MSEHDIVAQWAQKAAEDLGNAQFLYENRWPRPLELVCYLCQQSAEKALKAYIIHNGEMPPYTHDLGALNRLCSQFFANFSDILADCLDLYPYAAQTRYPSAIEITEEETHSALHKAKCILNFCTEHI